MNPNSTVVSPTARALRVPGAQIHYELRGSGPLMVLVGSPMDASAFAPFAEVLAAANTVVTLDPRGINRSVVDDPDRDSPPELRADDLSRLITHLGAGRAVVFGSSGGAVTALALAQAHPEQVHTVIAHEPPLCELLEDRDALRAGTEEMIATHLGGDVPGAWRRFLAQANIFLPEGMFEAMFGRIRSPQELADERFFFAHELRGTTRWRPDLAALRSSATRIIVGVGQMSAGQLCDRASTALAAALGIEATRFPGGHTGFLEDPAGFAALLGAVLTKA